MEFNQKNWLGSWENFEQYFTDENPHMQRAWQLAEEIVKGMPQMAVMFSQGAKAFWEKSCTTITSDNAVQLGGWRIEESPDGLCIDWLDSQGESIGRASYALCQVIEKGLEGKPNFLFAATKAPEDWPFRYVLSMAPMPKREQAKAEGYLSHLHFQYAARREELYQDGRLQKPWWYATMCDQDATMLQRCNVVLSLHRIPRWETLED